MSNPTHKYKCEKCNMTINTNDERINCIVCNSPLIELEIKQKDIFSEYQKIKQSQPDNIPKCPTCQSTNIEKISTAKKVVHGAAFGLFSNTARSQFHCNNCGYKW